MGRIRDDDFIIDRPVIAVPKENPPLCEGCCYLGSIHSMVNCSKQVKWLVERGMLDCSRAPIVYQFVD